MSGRVRFSLCHGGSGPCGAVRRHPDPGGPRLRHGHQKPAGAVCDPVAGLVEIPCIKRNVSGVSIAFTAAEMALAGIESKIPVDECIQAMKSVGDSMCSALKETALGGLAMTPTGIQYAKRIYNTAQ